MGKKRKQQWRDIDVSQAADSHAEQTQTANEEKEVKTKAAEDLFFTDKVGTVESKAQRKRRLQAASQSRVSEYDQDPIGSLERRKPRAGTPVPPPPQILDIWDNPAFAPKPAHLPKVVHEGTDIEAPCANQVGKKNGPSPHVKKLTVVPLLSVNPDKKVQQDAVARALAEDAKLKKAAKDIHLIMKGEHPSQQFSEEFLNAPVPEPEVAEPLPVKKSKRLTITERNKIKANKEKELLLAKHREEKKMRKQLNNLPHIMREVLKREEELKQRHDDKVANPRDLTAMRLSRQAKNLPEDFPEFLTTEEVEETQGQMRKAVTSLSVVEDQYKRFVKRNLIEPRLKQKKTKPKHKKTLVYRNSFKEDKHLFPRQMTPKQPKKKKQKTEATE